MNVEQFVKENLDKKVETVHGIGIIVGYHPAEYVIIGLDNYCGLIEYDGFYISNKKCISAMYLSLEKAQEAIYETCLNDIQEIFGDTKKGLDYLKYLYSFQKKYEPQDGDFVFYDKGSNDSHISIYKSSDDRKDYYYASFYLTGGNLFLSGLNSKYMGKPRLATNEEKQLLLKALAKNKMKWNETDKRIDVVPQKGDFIHVQYKNNDSCTFIYNQGDKDMMQPYTGVLVWNDGDSRFFHGTDYFIYRNEIATISFATYNEISRLENEIKANGYIWKAKDCELKRLRWRAGRGNWYYYVDNNGQYSSTFDYYNQMDNGRYGIGNYFKTKDEAICASEQVKELLKKISCNSIQ